MSSYNEWADPVENTALPSVWKWPLLAGSPYDSIATLMNIRNSRNEALLFAPVILGIATIDLDQLRISLPSGPPNTDLGNYGCHTRRLRSCLAFHIYDIYPCLFISEASPGSGPKRHFYYHDIRDLASLQIQRKLWFFI